MHIEIGTGEKTLVISNTERSHEVDVMLTRIATAYSAMVSMGYSDAMAAYRKCTLIFTSENNDCTGLSIGITLRPYGIYTDEHAYHKQIARALYTVTGMDVHECADAAVEIGIGGIDADTQGYALLKDALISLPVTLF